jgi:phage-related protein
MIHLREITWVGNTKDALKSFPKAVQREMGFTLHRIQEGKTPENVKPLKGFGSGVMEIVSNYNTNAYRAVYAVKVGDDIYVLHAFQKKSKTGIKTPKQEIELIRRRLAIAKADAKENSN